MCVCACSWRAFVTRVEVPAAQQDIAVTLFNDLSPISVFNLNIKFILLMPLHVLLSHCWALFHTGHVNHYCCGSLFKVCKELGNCKLQQKTTFDAWNIIFGQQL